MDVVKKPSALLLIGPTGAGKTPLGAELARGGLWSKRCFHFDFGAELRGIAEGRKIPPALGQDDVCYVKDVLQSGALLEKETFFIAEAIFSSFCERSKSNLSDLIVLNGLPRHLGQAGDLAVLVDVQAVAVLECSPGVVRARIRQNSGGDRSGRTDDSLDAVTNKLHIFEERTAPLVEYYRQRGADVYRLTVELNTQPPEIRERLEQLKS